MRAAMTAAACGGLFWAVGSMARAGEPLPADPTGKPNQMITACMEKQDPAMNKDDALQSLSGQDETGHQGRQAEAAPTETR